MSQIKHLFSLATLAILVVGCTDNIEDDFSIVDNTLYNPSFNYEFKEGLTVLGNRISIPYSIENLRAAFELLPNDTKSGFTIDDIQPTHYYVRFCPKNEEELDILINTPGLVLSETPLDREVLIGGIYYHDPDLPPTQPTYQYSTLEIPFWKSLTDTLSVEHELLIEAYMPDDISNTKVSGKNQPLPDYLYHALLKEAYRITGNVYEIVPETKGSSWSPTGRIRAYDDIVGGYTPVRDVVIRGSRFLTVKETTTDANGYFTLPSFNGSVSLKVVWEGDRWDVRNGNLGQAIYDGPTLSSGSWYLDIPSSLSESRNISAVFRAARRVYMGYNYGLTKPSHSRKEKIAYIHDEIDDGINGDYNRQLGMGIWSDIRIAGKNINGWRLVSDIFSTTCHELGHAAHYTNSTSNYTNSEVRVLDSWARFHQYLCTIKEYTELGVVSNLWNYTSGGIMIPDTRFNFQEFYPSTPYYQQYTSLFIDIYDDYNQHDYMSTYINDVVHGFPVSSLEGVVYNRTSFSEIKQHFLSIVNTTGYMFGMTVASIDELFSIYDGF